MATLSTEGEIFEQINDFNTNLKVDAPKAIRCIPDSFFRQNPAQQSQSKMLMDFIMGAAITPLGILSPLILKQTQKALAHSSATNPYSSDVLGITFALPMTALQLSPFSKEELSQIAPDYSNMLTLCAVEKIIDDLSQGVAHANGIYFNFPNSTVVQGFNRQGVRVTYNPKHLPTGLRSLQRRNLNHINLEIGNVIGGVGTKLKEKGIWDELSLQDQSYFNDPASFLLQMNLIGTYIAGQALEGANSEIVRKFAQRSLAARYSGVYFITRDPLININDALAAGEHTILTNYVFGAMAKFILDVHPEQIKSVEAHWHTIETAMRSASTLIRIYNDLGPVVNTGQKEVFHALESTHSGFRSLFPYEFFRLIDSAEFNPDYKQMLDRLIRDAKGDTVTDSSVEYNMALCSGMKGHINPNEAWGTFFSNIEYIKSVHDNRKSQLEQLLPMIHSISPEIAYTLWSFTTYNQELYARRGDYDTGFVTDIPPVLFTSFQEYRDSRGR
jgi:hypothetical protein